MSDLAENAERRQMLLTLRIIVAALFMGTFFFLLVVLVVIPGKQGSWDLGMNQIITLAALGFAGMALAMRAVVPGVVASGMLRQFVQREAGELPWKDYWTVYQTRTIVAGALIEGATFFLLIAHMLERSPWTLAAAVAMMVILLLHFPTEGRIDDWAQRQQRAMEEGR